MSVKYTPVQWTRSKWAYDAALVAGTGLFLWVFLYLTPEALGHARPVDPAIHRMRAFGACAFVMLTVILCIGPLARLDTRFLPLLYNRRHFGVLTCSVALTHAFFALNWYFAFSPTEKYAALLGSNTSYGQLAGFPYEILGVFALLAMLLLAVTSHDFWLKFLGPPLWKRIHYLIYPAYAALIGHVGLGVMQDMQNPIPLAIFVIGAGLVVVLHLAAALKETLAGDARARGHNWVRVCDAGDIAEGRARIAILPDGDRVAVFRHQGQLSAIANACAHQNGPLGEGRILDCLVTCPWHGFQYDVTTGRSPAPFTEKIPTYNLRLEGETVLVDPVANPPGTPVPPIPLPPTLLTGEVA
ncbi:MAG: ferric reductase-like transmembrane domain-containing protein [Marinibacterium sp.]|nr:ferric reductase-like transmembrane domain-containing protein [Marinibacterium sp.]